MSTNIGTRPLRGFHAIGAALGTTAGGARRLVSQGRLPVVRLSPRIVICRPDVLNAYLSDREREALVRGEDPR